MATLLDIAPAVATVHHQGKNIDVFGISVKGLVSLLRRFPQLAEMFAGQEIDVPALMDLSGDIVAAIIAAGCGAPGDDASEQVASRLPLATQADFLEAILKLTMPDGIGPFVERLQNLGGVLNLKSVDLPSVQPVANGAVPSVSSPQPSNTSSPSATP